MAEATFRCSVVTPESAVLDNCEATFVALPAHDGEIGIQRNRAPLLVQLGIGVLRVKTLEGTETFFVDRGFAQMVDNRLSVLTEEARRPGEIDRDQALQELEAARSLPVGGGDSPFDDARQVASRRAKMQLKLAPRDD